jgi:hypothetical protein
MAIMARFWLAVGRPATRFFRLDTSSRAVLVAAFVACNAGEYFYGGTALLTFTSLLALATSLPAEVTFAEATVDGAALGSPALGGATLSGAVLEEAPA